MASVPRDQWTSLAKMYASGLSMREVAERTGNTLNAVTYALRKMNVPRRSFADANRIVFAAKKPSFLIRRSASKRRMQLDAIGAALYWAEGHKSASAPGIDFANSDPSMVQLFMEFLRIRYKLDETRLRVLVYAYSNQDIEGIKKYWSSLLRIPLIQFTKSYIRTDWRLNARVMRYGMVHVRYSDKKLLLDVLNLIESYRSQHCAGGRVVNYTTL